MSQTRPILPLAIVATVLVVAVSGSPARAQATIDSMTVLTPSCGVHVPPFTTNAIIRATVTLTDCTEPVYREFNPGGGGSLNLCSFVGLGTHEIDFGVNAEVSEASTPIVAALALRLGVVGAVIAEKSMGFDCSTGVPSSCGNAPLIGCRTAAISKLKSKEPTTVTNLKDRFKWVWKKGESTTIADLGDPTATTSYSLCLYDGDELRAEDLFSADPGRWKATNSGYTWKDQATGPSGVNLGRSGVKLKSGVDGKSSIVVSSSRVMAPDPVYPADDLPVTVQLVNNESGLCFESVFDSSDVKKNETFLASDPIWHPAGIFVAVDK